MKCSNCGKEENINKMIPFNSGRVQYLCWECCKKGRNEAHVVGIDRGARMAKYETK